MNKEIKKQWVAALTSGEYKQGKMRLRREVNGQTKFCCLGVLCNLHAMAHPKIAARQLEPEFYMGSRGLPPTEVLEWAGLNGVPLVTINFRRKSLDEHNDNGASFEQIAKAIEKQL